MVERLNRTIKDVLSKYISVHETDWDRYIDSTVTAYNSTPHETTGISPYRMVYGEEMCIPVDIMTPALDANERQEMTPFGYVRKLESSLKAGWGL